MNNRSILIVEDEGIIAEDLAVKVRQLGYDVVGIAETGEEAIELTRQQRPALVLMDIRLASAMDGIVAAQQIYRDFKLPVLFLSANSDMVTIERTQQEGVFGYILKPFNDRDLQIQIEMAFYKHSTQQRLQENEDNLRKYALELQREIAERKQAEESLRKSEKQLRTMNNELERRVEKRTQELQETQNQYMHAEKLSAIGKLSASIAHEFNNPLQGIRTVLKGLKKRAVLEEEDKELLIEAIGEADRIKDLIRSLQDFNRPSSRRKTIMDVQNALESILILQKSDLNGRRISVVRDYMDGLPQIMAVRDQIKQVFLNLLTNAADACNHHGGVITISTWQEDNNVAVAIKDTGIGIKASDMEQIFRPFYTTKPEVKGTGLGLSVSHGIIKKHHGEIRVESKSGEGATFTVLLPIQGAVETATDR